MFRSSLFIPKKMQCAYPAGDDVLLYKQKNDKISKIILMSNIKIPYALKDGILVHVDSVERGLACGCLCPACNNAVQARQGQRNSHHFSHAGKVNCKPKKVLCTVAKLLLFNRINDGIENQSVLNFEWECECCYEKHTGNLLKKAASATMNHPLENCKPDIVIFDSNGNPTIAVEIVDSRAIENVSAYYQDNNIFLIRVKIDRENDLQKLENPAALSLDFVDYCPEHEKCSYCGGDMFKKYLTTIDIWCWKCQRQMKLAGFHSCGSWHGADDFSEHDCEAAKKIGAIIELRYSKTVKDKYLASCCNYCGTISGRFYFHNYIESLEKQKHLAVFTGYRCSDCDRHKEQESNDGYNIARQSHDFRTFCSEFGLNVTVTYILDGYCFDS